MHGQENAAQRCKEVAVKHAEEQKGMGWGQLLLPQEEESGSGVTLVTDAFANL